MAISVSQRALLRIRGRGTRAYCRVHLRSSRYFSCCLSRLLLLRLLCFFVAVSAPSSWLSSSPHTEFVSHLGYQKHSKTAPGGLDAEAWRLRQGFAAASADWLFFCVDSVFVLNSHVTQETVHLESTSKPHSGVVTWSWQASPPQASFRTTAATRQHCRVEIASRAGDGLHGKEQRPQELQSVAATNTDLRLSLGLASSHRCCLSSSSFCWKIPQVEILAQVATQVWSSRSGFLDFSDVRWLSFWECRLLLVSQRWSVRDVQFQVSSSAPHHRPPVIFVNREGPWEITRKVCHAAGLSRCPVLATTCTHVQAFSMSEFRPTLAQDPCRWVCHT